MPVPVWTDKLSVGLEGLDDDHKRLLEIIASLESGEDAAAVETALRALMRYAQLHFAREQAVMRRCGFPGLAGHIESHGAFKEKLKAEIDRFEANPAANTAATREALIAFLGDWWKRHISQDDRAYKPFIEQDKALAANALEQVRGAHVLFD